MQPITTSMMKDHKTFDDFLKGISFADFDTKDNDFDDDDLSSDETARIVFSGPIKVVAPVASPTAVDSLRRFASHKPTGSGRAKMTASRRRDRRRNQEQRERENAKRKIKQADFVKRRSDCFRAEYGLRTSICAIISSVMQDHDIDAVAAIALLPMHVRHVIARANAAMKQYRTFTGQKHICEQLNGFPVWPTGEN